MGNLVNTTKWAQFSSNRYVCYGGKSELLEFRCETRNILQFSQFNGRTHRWALPFRHIRTNEQQSTPCDAAEVHKMTSIRVRCTALPRRFLCSPPAQTKRASEKCSVQPFFGLSRHCLIIQRENIQFTSGTAAPKKQKKKRRKSGQKLIRTCSRTECAAHCLVAGRCVRVQYRLCVPSLAQFRLLSCCEA